MRPVPPDAAARALVHAVLRPGAGCGTKTLDAARRVERASIAADSRRRYAARRRLVGLTA